MVEKYCDIQCLEYPLWLFFRYPAVVVSLNGRSKLSCMLLYLVLLCGIIVTLFTVDFTSSITEDQPPAKLSLADLGSTASPFRFFVFDQSFNEFWLNIFQMFWFKLYWRDPNCRHGQYAATKFCAISVVYYFSINTDAFNASMLKK